MKLHFAKSNGEFVNTRVRFQRLSDSKIFTGWVENLAGPELLVRSFIETPVVGPEYLFELTGRKATLIFIASLKAIGAAGEAAAKTSRTKKEAEMESTFLFKILSDCRYGEPKESARKSVRSLTVLVSRSTGSSEVCAIDISPQGVGTVTGEQYEVGEIVRLTIPAMSRSITVDGEVRYSQPDKREQGMFRTGLKFEIDNRVDKAIWGMMMDAA